MEYVLADTGLWYAMFDARDAHYEQARKAAEWLEAYQIILPWPTLYETLRTRLVRNKKALQKFEVFLKRPNISYLDDIPYRDAALELSFESSLRQDRPLSMVDWLIRLIIEDANVKVNYLATFNPPDFIDVCARYQVEMILSHKAGKPAV